MTTANIVENRMKRKQNQDILLTGGSGDLAVEAPPAEPKIGN
jgi:hypothetical protein